MMMVVICGAWICSCTNSMLTAHSLIILKISLNFICAQLEPFFFFLRTGMSLNFSSKLLLIPSWNKGQTVPRFVVWVLHFHCPCLRWDVNSIENFIFWTKSCISSQPIILGMPSLKNKLNRVFNWQPILKWLFSSSSFPK